MHRSILGGLTGFERTFKRIRNTFWWEGMAAIIKNYVDNCLCCKQMTIIKKYGLLLPLPIPEAVRQDLSMDFITGLTIISGKSVIVVVVDRLSKFAHLGALPSSYFATGISTYFIHNIIKLHGFSRSIVSDRDKVFTGKFWKELNRLNGCKVLLSSAYHPQSDGQTEIVNKTIEHYLRSIPSTKNQESG